MKSLGIQNFISTVFNDSQARQEFQNNPEAVMTRYNLTEQEKTAVLKTYGRLSLATDSVQLESEVAPLGFWT